jgi:HEAT repeat protein
MTIELFLLDYIPGAASTDETLSKLTGLSNDDAAVLSRSWLSWTDDEVLDLQTKLVELAVVDTSFEFECIFKAALTHHHSPVRAAAILGLSETADTAAVSRILDLLTGDDDDEVRVAAATTIGSVVATRTSEGKLTERLRDRIFAALSEILNASDVSTELWRRSLEAVGAFGDARVNGYIERVQRSDAPEFKRSGLIAMARTSDPRWLDFVTGELENGDSAVRFEAVNALGEIGEESDAFYLEEPMDDQDLLVQLAAVAAAEKIAGPTAKRLLQIAGESPEPTVATAAAAALSSIADGDSLVHTVTPEMASEGMFGASTGLPVDDGVPYDAGEREGWSHIDEEGQAFHAVDNFREEDDDPLASLMDYEAAPGQFEDDD